MLNTSPSLCSPGTTAAGRRDPAGLADSAQGREGSQSLIGGDGAAGDSVCPYPCTVSVSGRSSPDDLYGATSPGRREGVHEDWRQPVAGPSRNGDRFGRSRDGDLTTADLGVGEGLWWVSSTHHRVPLLGFACSVVGRLVSRPTAHAPPGMRSSVQRHSNVCSSAWLSRSTQYMTTTGARLDSCGRWLWGGRSPHSGRPQRSTVPTSGAMPIGTTRTQQSGSTGPLVVRETRRAGSGTGLFTLAWTPGFSRSPRPVTTASASLIAAI